MMDPEALKLLMQLAADPDTAARELHNEEFHVKIAASGMDRFAMVQSDLSGDVSQRSQTTELQSSQASIAVPSCHPPLLRSSSCFSFSGSPFVSDGNTIKQGDAIRVIGP
ncbi:hypothetical protein [Cohaesibacter celericrescens]|uniref:Uncharacterized protein n=1 Tax=Cohaesibacter celericrescens TaxID=2067669 RepID=A0A2N5XVZ0_9HYPH|nr:hypothetical protein [Cohaesibacter celericrescens]PLW78595.1 hypothetical protein C0081_03810 [Cohaesibacter celericrescens]